MNDPTETTTTEAAAPDTAPVETTTPAAATIEPATPAVDPAEAMLAAMGGAKPDATAEPVAKKADAVEAAPVPEAGKPKEPTPEEAKAKIDAEMAELGISHERSQARFRELSAKAAENEPLKAQIQQLEVFRQRAVEWEEAVTSTGATPEEFGAAMNYLTLIKSGKSENLEIAFEQIEGEYLALAKALGRPTSAGYDPIGEHPDIAAKLANLDIDRDTALEVIAARNRAKVEQASRQTQQQQDSQQDGIAQGRTALTALEAELRVTDPAYAEKLKVLAPALQAMTQTSAPDQWAAAARRMFASLNMPKPVVPPPPVTVTPMRPGVTSGGHIRGISDPVDATLAAMGGMRQA